MEDNIPVRGAKAPVIDYSEDVEARLLAYAEVEINKMRASLSLGENGMEPTLYEVDQALCSYQDTNLALLIIHNKARLEYAKVKERFDDWYAEKYVLERDRLNPRTLSAQKWLSQKEIEMSIRVEYADEYKKRNWELIEAEHKLNLLRKLIESWASHQFVLTQLSKNLISEISGLGVENALDGADGGRV